MNAIRNDIFFQIGIEMLTLHYLNVSKVRTQIIPTSIRRKTVKDNKYQNSEVFILGLLWHKIQQKIKHFTI